MERFHRVLKASQELAFIPLRDWYKHMKNAIEEGEERADADTAE